MAIRTPARTVETHSPDAAAIRQQLDRLLASPHICHSKRCQSLLKYVVEAYLDGSMDRVKERIIGFEVFQRDADYDTNQDSVVRTTAAEVRKRLAQYYLEPGHENEIRFELPPGAYIPEFRVPAAVIELPSPVQTAVEPEIAIAPSVPKPGPRWFVPTMLVPTTLALIALGATSTWLYPRFSQTDLDRFWAPLLDDRSEAVICIEQPLRIFRFSGPRQDDLNAKVVGFENTPPAPEIEKEKTSVKLSEILPSGDRYFTYGDLMAATRLSELLARKGKSFQVLGDRSTSYHDLRGRPAILLGQFNNRWTNGLTSGLRYYFEKNLTSQTYELRDRQHPDKPVASVPKPSRLEEYAIVSRIFDPSTEKTVIAVVGMTFNGTLAGGDFLTQPAYMAEGFRNAPADWAHKNIQVVIKSAMVDGLPGPPKVVTTYFW
jgi:hypothetical protein